MARTTDGYPCFTCGQVSDGEDAALWDLHYRRKDGRQFNEPLWFAAEDVEDNYEACTLAMERNMAERGLCPGCGLPRLDAMTPDDFYTPEEAADEAAYHAEVAAERRMGC